MLSLMKKQIVTVFALGILLSVAPAHAAWTPNKAQLSVAAAVAAGTAYQRSDAVKATVKKVTDNKYTPAAIAALIAGVIAYNHEAIVATVKSIASQVVSR